VQRYEGPPGDAQYEHLIFGSIAGFAHAITPKGPFFFLLLVVVVVVLVIDHSFGLPIAKLCGLSKK